MNRQRGSALLVVLAFVAVLGLVLIANSRALSRLHKELQRLDQRQQSRPAAERR